MRTSVFLISMFLMGCGSSQAPQKQAQRDATAEPWYGQGVAELAGMNHDAQELLKQGKRDAASALITKGEALSGRLLAVPRPNLAAMEAASDLDQLYGQMLVSNLNYGWARLQFQKNVVRWKYWKPQTAETITRLNQAKAAIAEIDRKLAE